MEFITYITLSWAMVYEYEFMIMKILPFACAESSSIYFKGYNIHNSLNRRHVTTFTFYSPSYFFIRVPYSAFSLIIHSLTRLITDIRQYLMNAT
jgi:hypothetical protein